jgi:hypothetical protein
MHSRECLHRSVKKKGDHLNLDEAIKEWESKHRIMGCVSATEWLCKRLGFPWKPERLTRWTSEGEIFQHTVATDGLIRIDLSPYNDRPKND